MLGISPWTLRLYVARGALRATHVGRRVLISYRGFGEGDARRRQAKKCLKHVPLGTAEFAGVWCVPAHRELGPKSLGDELPDSHHRDDYHGSNNFIECA